MAEHLGDGALHLGRECLDSEMLGLRVRVTRYVYMYIYIHVYMYIHIYGICISEVSASIL